MPGQPGGVVPPARNPAGMKPAGQPGGTTPPARNPAGMRPAVQRRVRIIHTCLKAVNGENELC